MDRDGMMVWIGCVHIASQVRQPVLLCFGVLLFCLGKVVRHRALSGKTPDHWIGAPASNKIPPMLLHSLHAHSWYEISPKTNHACSQAMIRKMLHSNVGHVEIGWIDTGEIAFPGKSIFVGAAIVKGFHVGIKAGDNLHHGESLLHSIGRKFLKAIRTT